MKTKKTNTPKELMNVLNSRIGSLTEGHITFHLNGNSIENDGTKRVVNRLDNPLDGEVLASQWFDDIWLYLKIWFLPIDDIKSVEQKPFVSACFFQGEDKLRPLFRAEWDSYPIGEKYNHPQPHWHISYNDKKEETFDSLSQEDEEGAMGDFAELSEPVSQSLNLYRMHFAMSGDWAATGNMVSFCDNYTTIAEWINHLLVHVREEIEFAKRNK